MSNILITLRGNFLEKTYEGKFTDLYLFLKDGSSVPITISIAKGEQVILMQTLELEVELFGRYKVFSNGSKRYTNCIEMVRYKQLTSRDDAQVINQGGEESRPTKEQEVELEIKGVINKGKTFRNMKSRMNN